MTIDAGLLEFDWDKGNVRKNKKHRVEDSESEEVFFDENKVILRDVLHSQEEERFVLIGKTKKERILVVVFSKRKDHRITPCIRYLPPAPFVDKKP